MSSSTPTEIRELPPNDVGHVRDDHLQPVRVAQEKAGKDLMDPLVHSLHDAFESVRSDGLVPRSVASRLRAVLGQRGRGSDPAPHEIVSALPAFETLPANARQSLYATVLGDDSWSMWLRRAAWRHALVRAGRTVVARIPARYPRLRHLVYQGELLFLIWHARVVHELYRRWLSYRGWNSGEPTLAALMKIAGLEARVIASSYLRDAPQPLDTAAYWHDPARHNTVGVVVGIDFIVNEQGVWFVESNLNVGLMEERSRLYETDPFVVNMVRFAKQNGYTSLVFLACNDYPVDPIMAARIEQAALANGLRATILEDRNAPKGRLSQTFLVPPLEGEKVLVVRSKMYHTALDALFHNKTLSLQTLEAYQRVFGDDDAQLPRTGIESIPDTFDLNGPFPNLVYKFPERDQGQGVIFLKVPSLARAQAIVTDPTEMNRHSVANLLTKLRYRLNFEDQKGVFQAYVPSYLLEGRKLSIARAHVLATPIGVTFLSAHRVVSNRPVPESLPEGVVDDSRPYIVNYSLDSEHRAMPPDEELRVSKAALSVVRALCWAVEARFQTAPAN
jgi:hypothetical protein